MKRTTYIVMLLLAWMASACGAARSPSAAPAAAQGGSAAGELPVAVQLILGTLKLEGTPQAVTREQAQELLPLWQTMKVLSESDTAADQEKQALIEQIQETMTKEQRQAIQAMNLTRADMASLMQRQGPAVASGSQNGSSQTGNSSRNGGRVFQFSDRGFGGPPPDGGGPGFSGGQNLSREQIATAQASRQSSGSSVPPMLINAVIEYLQGKV